MSADVHRARSTYLFLNEQRKVGQERVPTTDKRDCQQITERIEVHRIASVGVGVGLGVACFTPQPSIFFVVS